MRLPTKSLTAAASLIVLLATSAGCTEVSEDGGGGSGAEATSTASATGVAIQCGSASCSECCLDHRCASKADCDRATEDSIVIYCDGPEDCSNGTTCCSCPRLAGSTSFFASCNTPALCSGCPYFFCHSAADCGGDMTCEPWELADYVSVCSE